MNSYTKLNFNLHFSMKHIGQTLLLTLLLTVAAVSVPAQYNSGSTGADGAFDFSVDRPDCPLARTLCTIQLPPSGIFNVTTMFVPGNKTIFFARNAANTPVMILAQGDVRIEGRINLTGGIDNAGEFALPSIGGPGGPGGFDGGAGGYRFPGFFAGFAGNGPGGGSAGGNPTTPGPPFFCGSGGGFFTAGTAGSGPGGLSYGNANLVPLIGGSGGGGGSSSVTSRSFGGGGGGGAILIASSGAIRGSNTGNFGNIDASGGSGSTNSGGGAGGAIRFAANLITGNLLFSAIGRDGFSANCTTGVGSEGRIRLEALSYVGFASNLNPNAPNLSFVLNPQPALPTGVPSITITSLAGQTVPNPPSNSPHGVVDVQVARTFPNPVNVTLAASNIPLGTPLRVTIQPNAGVRTTVDSTPLAGTIAASTATASINLPEGVSLVTATVIFFPPPLAGIPSVIGGEKVEKVEVSSTFGGNSEITYITVTGKRVKAK